MGEARKAVLELKTWLTTNGIIETFSVDATRVGSILRR
jgi:hypothetical protein